MNSTGSRGLRIALVALGAFGVLYLRFSAGFWEENEATRLIHWGMLPIAGLFGFAAWALEMSRSGSAVRRDVLWALAGSLVAFVVFRITST